jgi:large subunit ribosomal protein L18
MARNKKAERRLRVKRGIRRKVSGTASSPRLSVFRSNRHTYAQLIDDIAGKTLVSASTFAAEVKGETPVAVAHQVGIMLAERAKEAGIEKAVFDRNGYRYHGRVKAVAEGARKAGLVV